MKIDGRVVMRRLFGFFQSTASLALFTASVLFLFYNYPAVEHFAVIAVCSAFIILIVVWQNLRDGRLFLRGRNPDAVALLPSMQANVVTRILMFLLQAGLAVLLVGLFVKAVFLNPFQPFVLYDAVVYLCAFSWGVFAVLLVIDGVRGLVSRSGALPFPLPGISALLMGMVVAVPFFWTVRIVNTPEFTPAVAFRSEVFSAGDEGYAIYRRPGVALIPAGSILADGTTLPVDRLLVFCEGWKTASSYNGGTDLMMKYSNDRGRSWSAIRTVTVQEGDVGGIGNPTPVFVPDTGMLLLPYTAGTVGDAPALHILRSGDGGQTWSDPEIIGAGIPGPGHGIVITAGEAAGRVVVPVYDEEGIRICFSEDFGVSWRIGPIAAQGGEGTIAERADGALYLSFRPSRSATGLHLRLHRLFSISVDAGETWSAAAEHPEIPEPLYAASVIALPASAINGSNPGRLAFANPAVYFGRARMGVRFSDDAGINWSDPVILYRGPSGGSGLVVFSDGAIACIFENGKIEYDERITFALLNPEEP